MLPERCEFCGCSRAEPCWDIDTNWYCELEDGICSSCIDDTVEGLEPTAIDLAYTVPVSGVFL
jgi:hypothetical protein